MNLPHNAYMDAGANDFGYIASSFNPSMNSDQTLLKMLKGNKNAMKSQGLKSPTSGEMKLAEFKSQHINRRMHTGKDA